MIRPFKKQLRAIKKWIRSQRKGRFSRSTAVSLITRPLWQRDRVRAWMGAPLVAAMVMGATSSAMPSTDSLQVWDISQPASDIPGFTQVLTDHTYFLPVAHLTGISQTFHAGHPGIDFRAPLGTDVVSLDDGVVTDIVEQQQGYGRHVFVTDTDGKVVLYAHVGLIMVEVGDQIKAGQKVAEIGMTGWTTGPHLHFEVMQDGAKINPLPLVSKALASLPR
jgi:murein DD-endopeptidase MepM/ murein hydrolase activator NlpD